jgi:hypothetical protein
MVDIRLLYMTLKAITAITMTNASHAGEWTWPGAHGSHRDSRAAGLWLLAPGKARARQSDAGVALAEAVTPMWAPRPPTDTPTPDPKG